MLPQQCARVHVRMEGTKVYVNKKNEKVTLQYSHSAYSANNDIALPRASAPRGGHALPGNGTQLNKLDTRFARENNVCCHSNARVGT